MTKISHLFNAVLLGSALGVSTAAMAEEANTPQKSLEERSGEAILCTLDAWANHSDEELAQRAANIAEPEGKSALSAEEREQLRYVAALNAMLAEKAQECADKHGLQKSPVQMRLHTK